MEKAIPGGNVPIEKTNAALDVQIGRMSFFRRNFCGHWEEGLVGRLSFPFRKVGFVESSDFEAVLVFEFGEFGAFGLKDVDEAGNLRVSHPGEDFEPVLLFDGVHGLRGKEEFGKERKLSESGFDGFVDDEKAFDLFDHGRCLNG